MTETETTTPAPGKKARDSHAEPSLLRRVFRAKAFAGVLALWRRVYGPIERPSARFLDWLGADDRRRGRASLALAIAINLIVLTLMSTFARVQIWIPNAPSDTIQLTLVEPLPFDLPLRDPELDPVEPEPQPEEVVEPEPEPEIVEELEPEPEPEPEPVPAEEPPAEPEPEVVEPAPEPEPEPEPELNLDLEPQLAPPAEDPEPLILEPEPAQPELEEAPSPEVTEEPQSPAEDSEQPLLSVEPESPPEVGLDEVLGENEAEGEDEARKKEEEEAPLAEAEPEAPSGDDMFDEEPVFGRRQFVLPQVALPGVDLSGAEAPPGEAAFNLGDSGVVAIFCPEHFSDVEKQKECAGRPEIRSGWRPGASGEDWSKATELLKQDRNRGIVGPTVGPAADLLYRKRELERTEDLNDFRRSQDSVNNLPDSGDDNLMRGVEGNRPDIGPKAFEPGWAKRETPDGVSQEDIEELKKKIEEDGEQ
ncbi:MAG: hypothetical protein R3C58_13455 [Parvularculaceae bacterium]